MGAPPKIIGISGKADEKSLDLRHETGQRTWKPWGWGIARGPQLTWRNGDLVDTKSYLTIKHRGFHHETWWVPWKMLTSPSARHWILSDELMSKAQGSSSWGSHQSDVPIKDGFIHPKDLWTWQKTHNFCRMLTGDHEDFSANGEIWTDA